MKSLLFYLLLFAINLNAQENCQGSFTEYYLNSNNIRASFFARGNKFTSVSEPSFLFPFPQEGRVSSIFASSPWMAGLDAAGNLRSSSETYPNTNEASFSVGPLTSIGTLYPDSVCMHFDRVWSVFAEDIIRHKQDFEADFVLDDTISSIFSWPGRGNPFSKVFNGFTLPETGYIGLAPFRDYNSNGIYEPDQGDYPVLCTTCTSDYFPDQMMWMVFNDVLLSDSVTGQRPMRVEFHLMAFAFHCQDNEMLNNTIFNRYKIISRAVTPIDSVFFGMWTDYDLGCSADDFVGSDSLRSTEFVYNADPVDGDVGNGCSTGADTYSFGVPPVQSMTYLDMPMHSFIRYDNAGVYDPFERYQLLNGRWPDGSSMRPAGDGYDEDTGLSPTKFLFHGNPTDPGSWAANNAIGIGSEIKTVSSISLGRFNPGTRLDVTLAYTFHHDPDADHLGQITQMYANIDSLKKIAFTESPCLPYPLCLDGNCVWPGDFDQSGRVDHEDLLTWGVLNGETGSQRNGLISWRGHYADEWTNDWNNTNAKHADGDGNGIVDIQDIEVHQLNHLFENDNYDPQHQYPFGYDIILSADQGYSDHISNLHVKTKWPIDELLGISFEIEFDTSIFEQVSIQSFTPDGPGILNYTAPADKHAFYPYAFVQTDQENISIEADFNFCRSVIDALALRPGKTIPDSTVIRLRNLKGVDREGNDLHLGSPPLTVYRDSILPDLRPPKSEALIFPNPVKEECFILLKEETECRIYDLHGRLVGRHTVAAAGDSIQVGDLPSGLYVLHLESTGETFKLAIQ